MKDEAEKAYDQGQQDGYTKGWTAGNEEADALDAEIVKLKVDATYHRNKVDELATLTSQLRAECDELKRDNEEWLRMSKRKDKIIDADIKEIANLKASLEKECADWKKSYTAMCAEYDKDITNLQSETGDLTDEIESCCKELGDAGILITQGPKDGIMKLINERDELKAERDKVERRFPCGHRIVDWDDSYGECVVCKIKAQAHDYDRLPHDVIECHDRIEELQAERDAAEKCFCIGCGAEITAKERELDMDCACGGAFMTAQGAVRYLLHARPALSPIGYTNIVGREMLRDEFVRGLERAKEIVKHELGDLGDEVAVPIQAEIDKAKAGK